MMFTNVPPMILPVAGVLGAWAVGAGAFGAHALKSRLDATALQWWNTAAHYLLTHAVLLACVGVGAWITARAGAQADAALRETLASALTWWSRAAVALTLGSLVFAGTLQAMALGGPRVLGAVTPIGGTLLILGWLCVGVAGSKLGAA